MRFKKEVLESMSYSSYKKVSQCCVNLLREIEGEVTGCIDGRKILVTPLMLVQNVVAGISTGSDHHLHWEKSYLHPARFS